ncbi:MAG: hypothetical protein NT056_06200 [Proteobacteria bacterium]|nr:hypothetical protein [Pseudomonadota bacterium]
MSYYWRIGYWVEMGMGSALDGGISNNTGGSYRPSIVIGLDGNPIITWYDWSSSNPEIYVRRWDGSAWVEMGAGSASGGGISNTTYESTYPSIAMGSDGNPVITWKDWVSGGSYETYVRKWNGSAWVEMGTGSASGGGISNNAGMSLSPSVIVSSDGNPIIAWEDNTSGDYEVYIRKWNGSAWVEMGTGSASSGGISNNSGYSGVPSLLLGSDGNPIVAWVDNSSGSGNTDIYIRRWNGSAWMEMGTGSASGGGISNSEMGTSGPFLAMGSDGKPIIAWRDDTLSGPSYDIFVKRWSGSAWVEMGTGSASSGGISNNAGNSEDPSIVIGLDGNPVIVWDDFSGGNDEIYVKRWNGSAWMEMGTGSASAGGISNNAGQSYWAAIAIGPDGRPIVAWYDNTGTDWEIYVLEWGGLIYY